jgi:hypothetical protein
LDFEIAIEAGGINEDLKVEAKGWGLADSHSSVRGKKFEGGNCHWRRTFPPLGQRGFRQNLNLFSAGG